MPLTGFFDTDKSSLVAPEGLNPNGLFGYGQPGYGIPNYSNNSALTDFNASRAALDTPHAPGTPWDVVLQNGEAQSVPDVGGGLHFYGPISHDGPIATSDPSEIAHKDRQFKTASNQAAIKIAALIGGGTLLGNALPALGGSGAADGLTGVTTGGASYLPGGTEGFLGAPASEGLSTFPALGGESAAGDVIGASTGAAQASGEYGATAGGSGGGYVPPGAYQASGEYASSPSWLSKLTQLGGSGGGSPSGGQPQPQFAAPMQPRAGTFLQQIVRPRPNYLGRFGDSVLASQQANNLLLAPRLFGRGK